MGVSKATVMNALSVFKNLQDTTNANKFVAKEADKGLISNADQQKLDGIASGAQVNIIESVSVDGLVQPVNNKRVSIDMSAYVKGTDVASNLKYRGSVNSHYDLPASGQRIGDMYDIRTSGGFDANGNAIKSGDNVFWTGTGWDVFSGNVDLSRFVEKVDGKDLSSNDFTDEFKTKLETIDENPIEIITEAEVQALFN